MKKVALITGINGQDGSYLSEFLIDKGYEVWGILKRNSVSETQTNRIQHLRESGKVQLEYADLTDMASLIKVLQKCAPDEIYNLAAQSLVAFKFPKYNLSCNPNFIFTAAFTTLFVTKFVPLLGDSWLNNIPFHTLIL